MKKLITSLAALAAMAGAQAATTSFEFNLPVLESTDFSSATGNLGLFDTSLGQLTGASLEYTTSATLRVRIRNTSGVTRTATVTPKFVFLFASSLQGVSDLLANESVSLTGSAQTVTLTGGNSTNYGPVARTATNTLDLGSVLGVLQAAGGGSFSVLSTGESGMSFLVSGGSGSIGAADNGTSIGLGARVTYTYTPAAAPVPEPATALMALAGLALVGGVATARRRQA